MSNLPLAYAGVMAEKGLDEPDWDGVDPRFKKAYEKIMADEPERSRIKRLIDALHVAFRRRSNPDNVIDFPTNRMLNTPPDNAGVKVIKDAVDGLDSVKAGPGEGDADVTLTFGQESNGDFTEK